MNPATNNWR